MATQAKRGRPRKTAVAPAVENTPAPEQPKKKFSVKQNLNQDNVVREYRTSSSGAVTMLHQKNITVYDKEADVVRQIRYCPTEQSIFVDEQSERAVRKSVIFREGRLFVRPDQPNLKHYLDVHPANKANGGSMFYLVDKEKKATVDVDKEFVMADAIILVKEKPFEDLLSVAASLGFNVDRQAAEIKHDLLMFAKKSPAQFIKMFDNPEVTMKAKIRMAIKYGIIDAARSGVRWKDSGTLIVSVPAGKNPIDVFLRFLLTEAGAPTVEELDRQL